MTTKHWETTLTGVLTIVGALANAGLAYLHGQPFPTAITFTAITTGVGLIRAADANKV